MKRERLTRFQARRLAQRLANESEQAVTVYKQESVTGVRHFGVVTDRHVKGWQRGASVDCRYPEYGPPAGE